MIDVSVPCSCGASLSFGQTACSSCKATVPPELSEALEARLAASHGEYAEAKRSLGNAAWTLFILGLVSLVPGLFIIFLYQSVPLPSSISEGENVVPALFIAQGLLFMGGSLAARRAPQAGFMTVLGIWLPAQIAMIVTEPAAFFISFASMLGIGTIFAKVIVLYTIVRGILAAHRLTAIRSELSRGKA